MHRGRLLHGGGLRRRTCRRTRLSWRSSTAGRGRSSRARTSPAQPTATSTASRAARESECTAVGTYINMKQDLDGTLVETWNGGFWSIRPSPDGSTYLNNLGSVSCYSRAFCAAVGQETPHHDSFGQTLAETTKTADWAVEPSAERRHLGERARRRLVHLRGAVPRRRAVLQRERGPRAAARRDVERKRLDPSRRPVSSARA